MSKKKVNVRYSLKTLKHFKISYGYIIYLLLSLSLSKTLSFPNPFSKTFFENNTSFSFSSTSFLFFSNTFAFTLSHSSFLNYFLSL